MKNTFEKNNTYLRHLLIKWFNFTWSWLYYHCNYDIKQDSQHQITVYSFLPLSFLAPSCCTFGVLQSYQYTSLLSK